jgi:hypothetical protein
MLANLVARFFPPSNAVTEGASPKVTIPVLVLLIIAAAVIIVGAVSGTGTVLAAGLAILGAAIPAGAAGAVAGPGSVVVGAPVIGTPSDEALSADAQHAIAAVPEPPVID